jgi:GxxExxY protein
MASEIPENDIAREIVDAAFKVHSTLGPGLLESVYQAVLTHELHRRGLRVQREVPIGIGYDNLRFDVGFRADLLVNERVIVELKSSAARIKDGITRVVNGLPEEPRQCA